MTRDLIPLGVSLASVAAFVALMRALGVANSTTIALGLLILVLVTATWSRRRVAVVTAVVATIAFNFFFLPPVGTFTIADPQNWVALMALLVTAVVASHLSAMAQARAQEAVERRNELTRLFDLSRDVLLTGENEGSLNALARHIARRFDLTGVALYVPSAQGWQVHHGGEREFTVDESALGMALARAGAALEFDARQRAYGGHAQVRGADGRDVLLVPVRFGTRPIGLLATPAAALDAGALDAVAGLAAIAIERLQLLSERKDAELARQRADLASTLLASLSHDLRTPLTAIQVALGNLHNSAIKPEERLVQQHIAQAELDRLTRLVRDILDMARIEAQAVEVHFDWVTPADIVDAATANLQAIMADRRVEIDADASTLVQVEPRLTSAALSHLIENALQYSPVEEPIVVRGWVEDDGLRLTVADRGPGLDPTELDHLFERFYRGRQTRHGTFGTGMGLAIARGLLAVEGGRVWGENVERGARFSIAIPSTHKRLEEAHF